MPDDIDASRTLSVEYFDGRQARPQVAQLRREGWEAVLSLPSGDVRLPWRDIEWPERGHHNSRTAHLANGGSLHSKDGTTWDRWLRAQQVKESWVVQAQQSWRATLVAVVALLIAGAALYQWGLPLASRGVLTAVPASVDRQIGESTLSGLDGGMLRPTKIPADRQAHIQQAFQHALQRYRRSPPGAPHADTPVELIFRSSRIGPNAFALPGGTMVVTDELVTLLDDRPDVLLGVLGHELGHVDARHGMRTMVQTSLLTAVTSLAFGDISGLIASAPALLGHLHYSRQMEGDADQTAIEFMKANRMRPGIMEVLFTRLQEHHRGSKTNEADQSDDSAGVGWAFSSHPADAERIARFKAADTAP